MIRNTLLAGWLTACCVVLVFTLYAYSPGPQSDAGVLFAGAMSVLTFPSGLLISGGIAALAVLGDGNLPEPLGNLPPSVGLLVLWLVFCMVGYFQWFRLIPWLWRKLRPSDAIRAK